MKLPFVVQSQPGPRLSLASARETQPRQVQPAAQVRDTIGVVAECQRQCDEKNPSDFTAQTNCYQQECWW